MNCVYHPGYYIPLPPGHPFPIAKFPLLKDRLLIEGILLPEQILEPAPLDWETIELVHTYEYLQKLASSGLTSAEQRQLGMPWSESLWLRSRLAAGGTLLAARIALRAGLAGNLGGGTHHAFPDHGEGFCVLNDVAIAIVKLRHEGLIQRATVLDLDVHQGNGTAAIFEAVEEVFTFSMHGERNYPAVKMRSRLDVGLRDGMGDVEYLDLLARALPSALVDTKPEIAFYVAGVDVAAGDRYGRIALSDEGIRLRDRMVIHGAREHDIPLVIVLGGGYASSRDRTAELHMHVFREAAAYERLNR